ncbi:hypothetical protein V1512DRAFT_260381 [Lipomyces arxii]|uniref:uncharacterized protein n=1 Tax=Lipomyces arxii TaxID=56418 RepID=UPI0034CECA5D
MAEQAQPVSPDSLRYHIFRSGKSDYYLSTNPSAKYLNVPVGPSYYIRVLTMKTQHPADSIRPKPDSSDDEDSDNSFSIVVLVHEYDNELETQGHSGLNDDTQSQDVYDSRNNSSLVPIMHIRRQHGESEIHVSVVENGEFVWETDLKLHCDPYTGKSKFVFRDPWHREWEIVGKENLKCSAYLQENTISTLDRKHMPDAKIGWLSLSQVALKMLDLMVGVNMSVQCFWSLEHDVSQLTRVATGLIPADVKSARALRFSKVMRKKAMQGRKFKINFFKKANSIEPLVRDGEHATSKEKSVSDDSHSSPLRIENQNIDEATADTRPPIFGQDANDAHQNLSQKVQPIDNVNDDYSHQPVKGTTGKLHRRLKGTKKEKQLAKNNLTMETITESQQSARASMPNFSSNSRAALPSPQMSEKSEFEFAGVSRRSPPSLSHPFGGRGEVDSFSMVDTPRRSVPVSIGEVSSNSPSHAGTSSLADISFSRASHESDTRSFAEGEQESQLNKQHRTSRMSLPPLSQLFSISDSHYRQAAQSSDRRRSFQETENRNSSSYKPVNTSNSGGVTDYGMQIYGEPPRLHPSQRNMSENQPAARIIHRETSPRSGRRVLQKSGNGTSRIDSLLQPARPQPPVTSFLSMGNTATDKKKKHRVSMSAIKGIFH